MYTLTEDLPAELAAEESPSNLTASAPSRRSSLRVRPIMRQGTPASLPETWMTFATIDAARKAIKAMYHDDRVLRAFVVSDTVPPQFVEWVDR